MALAIINIKTATPVSGDSTTLAYTSNVTAGSVLVAGGFDFNTSSTTVAPTISSSNNGAWTVRKFAFQTTQNGIEVWLATKDNATAGADTVTWNPAGASADMGGWFICEVTGATNPSLDVVPAASQTTGLTPSIASGVLAQAAEILFAIMAGDTNNGTVTIAGDGTYTELVNNGDNATSQMGQAQYKIVASTSSDTADWTVTDSGGSAKDKVSILISLKDAGGAADTLWAQSVM